MGKRPDEGEPVRIGTGKRERVKTRIVAEDDEGRVIDLHALRTTLKHYRVLGLTDTAAAIDRFPVSPPRASHKRRREPRTRAGPTTR